jgi:transposase
MQGKHHFQSRGVVYIDMEKLIPAHHMLRKINNCVDFSFIMKLTRDYYCQHNGRPSIDPEVFFRGML